MRGFGGIHSKEPLGGLGVAVKVREETERKRQRERDTEMKRGCRGGWEM